MATNKKKFKYHSRKFLNKTQGLAAIECTVDSWDFGEGIEAEVKITDCSRSVRLDFSFYDAESLPQMYKKLTLFLEQVEKMHDYFVENYEDIAQAMKEKEEKRKARLAEIKAKGTSKILKELAGDDE
jgi:hypothetical protein